MILKERYLGRQVVLTNLLYLTKQNEAKIMLNFFYHY